jgi:GNAT superfamily N-acetyltransferase
MKLYNVKECQGEAIEILWQLLCERPDYANISHDGKPDRNKHVSFVMAHPYREWCLIMTDVEDSGPNKWHRWVGAIYITHQNELGIAILERCQRKGYARQAIDLMMQRHPRDYYLANVAPGNHPSHRLWESFENHAICQVTYRITRGEDHGSPNP